MFPSAGRFFVALAVFGLIYFFLPDTVRPWYALIIVLGALAYQGNVGALEEVREQLQ